MKPITSKLTKIIEKNDSLIDIYLFHFIRDCFRNMFNDYIMHENKKIIMGQRDSLTAEEITRAERFYFPFNLSLPYHKQFESITNYYYRVKDGDMYWSVYSKLIELEQKNVEVVGRIFKLHPEFRSITDIEYEFDADINQTVTVEQERYIHNEIKKKIAAQSRLENEIKCIYHTCNNITLLESEKIEKQKRRILKLERLRRPLIAANSEGSKNCAFLALHGTRGIRALVRKNRFTHMKHLNYKITTLVPCNVIKSE